ncbi:MAG: hypothetical protein SOZ89_00455 [Peptoniphilaceae bacterium]|nr:hypothetical protein [Peptoniphilaceae bacterium]
MYPLHGSGEAEFKDEIFPVANRLYGGILLFENPLEEDPNNIIPPSDNSIIGYASDNVNSTDNPLRGSANLTETVPLEDGYKFVWDFSTSQANGRIASLALTHYRAGRFYYGNSFSRNACLLLNRTYLDVNKETQRAYIGLVEGNPTDNTFISLWPRENKTLEIIKFKEAYSSIGLTDSVLGSRFQEIEKTAIDLTEYYGDFYYWNDGSFYDGKDGYWYGFLTKSNYDSGLIRRIKIKKDDYSTQVDQWDLGDIRLDDLGSYPSKDSNYAYRSIGSVIKEGYLYAINRDRKRIYKININNPVDISYMDMGFKSDFSQGGNTYSYLYQWGDHILGYDFSITKDDKIIKNYGKDYSGTPYPYVSTPTIEMGPFRIGYGVKSGTLYKNLYLHTPYLGTINNLSSPILKTADKTMKITYTLTEEE